MAALVDLDTTFKCNTCKACFATTEKIKDHYRSNWHVLNSKRRVQELLPLSRAEFKALVQANNKTQNSKNGEKKSNNKVVNDPKEKTVTKAQDVSKPGTTSLPECGKSHNNEVVNTSDNDGEDEEEVWEDVDDDDDDGDGGGEGTGPRPPIAPNISIFDDKSFSTTEECVQYMATSYGFFLPDVEYLEDLDGLLLYLGEKVKLGGYCLYCQKLFTPGRPCQNHMMSKSHCKLRYEEGVDLDEYEDFYDFTASYEDVEEDEEEEEEVDEDGNVLAPSNRNLIEFNSAGELVLKGGEKVLGHRDFRLYYKQYYRPADTRATVLAAQREELLRLGGKFGGLKHSVDEVEGMGDVQVMDLLIKYQKEVRKGTVVEQRAQQRKQGADQRKEIQSKAQKVRSSEVITNKIRDYHRSLA
mmetsp:Transcript_28953/g.48614  ORF Transcript_28953/g.48614 Transcript_28953/m.48614 type:complete len:412 (+) Transcript_28953:30-1265(+)